LHTTSRKIINDADSNGELFYTVLYGFEGTEGGEVTTVWETLKLETQETELVISEEHLASLGGEKGQIKVVVSDGVNASEPFLSPGAHLITLTVEDSHGVTDQTTATLVVSR
jgi:hypothetical protein